MATKVIKEKNQSPNLIVHDIRVMSVDRTMKDIGKWRNALSSAESVYYPNRCRLYDLYADVLLDGHLSGIINKRMDEVLNKSMSFVCNNKRVDALDTFLTSAMFRDIVAGILETRFWGITGFEFVPGTAIEFEMIPRKHIKAEKSVIALDQSSYEGVDYSNIPNVWVIGKKRDYGLLLQCSPYALYKKGGFADWSQYVEIFGQPVRIFKYDAHDLKTKNQLQTVADEAGSSLSILMPKQAEFEMMDGKMSNGNGELQERMVHACNNEMSILILGNTETTSNSNGGSNAKAQEHGRQQMQVSKSDMAYVLTHLNSTKFFEILKSYGLPVEGGQFEFEKEIDLSALSQKITIDVQVSKLVPIADDYFYETYSVPKPDDYEARRKILDEMQRPQQKDPDEETVEKEPVPKKPKKKHDKKDVKNLSLIDKLRLSLTDFFAHAHNG